MYITIEEMLKPYTERPFRHTEIIEKDNALEFAQKIWDMACKAQMEAVFSHCQDMAASGGNTNGHAIKHWVKLVPCPRALKVNGA